MGVDMGLQDAGGGIWDKFFDMVTPPKEIAP
jgi:hypothetical protein